MTAEQTLSFSSGVDVSTVKMARFMIKMLFQAFRTEYSCIVRISYSEVEKLCSGVEYSEPTKAGASCLKCMQLQLYAVVRQVYAVVIAVAVVSA